MKHFFVMVTVALLTLVLLSPSEGKNRPTVSNLEGCISEPDNWWECEGLICFCCYDDGCWICDKNFKDCEWDPAYRAQIGILPQTGPLSITPQSGNRLKQEALINLLEKKEIVTKKELVEEMKRIRKASMEGALEGGRLKESVAAQKRINRYFHTEVVPKLKTCWDQLQGNGTIEIKYRYEDNAKGGWAFKTLKSGKSNLPKGQDEAALACMQKAVTETSFPREKSDTGASYFIDWNWPVPMPPDAAQQVERMVGSGGGEGAGCDGHGAPARCVTCSGSPLTCIYVCVGSDTCEVGATTPGGFDSICTEGGKCASGGPFGVVGGVIMY